MPINGCNNRGLGLVGASAHTTPAAYLATVNTTAVPAGLLAFEAWQSDTNTQDACRRFMAEPFAGKSFNMLVGDAQGDSAVLELVPGHPAHRRPQPPGRKWNASTNTFLSGKFPLPDEAEYQQCSYARYGRITQPFVDEQADYTRAAMQQLMRDIAMPGPVCTGFGYTWKTAYSSIMSLREGKVYLSPGHPDQTTAEVVTL
jgi:hypothetical protein